MATSSSETTKEDAAAETSKSSVAAAPPDGSVQQALHSDGKKNDGEQQQQQKEETEQQSSRQRALDEANEVLDIIGGQNHLDAFHLLGVVANPRGGTAISSPDSFHGRYDTPEPSGIAEMTSNLFGADVAAYYQSLESTISQVTGQMAELNVIMEDWSRYILEDEVEQEKPESQLAELPEHLQNLDLSSLNGYLEKSGAKAAAFQEILLTAHELDNNSRLMDDEKTDFVDTSDIPEVFFRKDFDLTDPDTFRQLLLLDDTGGSSSDGPVQEWFPLVAPDALNAHEDKIELALLQQVRANSGKFFAESQRFAQLQEWIQSLLTQVVELQTITGNLKTDLLVPMETVPVADTQRAELRKLEFVLERADDMLLCKHGLGGVLSVHDDLTAIEQIQYGRRLLNGEFTDDESTDVVELGRLHSFKAVSDQLNQYEQLVVSNLRDELVEIFLSWNAESSVYGNGAPSPNKASHHELVHARVREIAGALRTCKSLAKTKDAYATRLQDVIRMTVRTTVGEFATDIAPTGAVQSVAMSTTAMALNRFLDCLDMLFEQLLALLNSAKGVDAFFVSEGLDFERVDEDENGAPKNQQGLPESSSGVSPEPATPLASVVIAAAELSAKSISELLRLRKDAHTLVTLEEMKSIWDACMAFTLQLEEMSGSGHTSSLRSTLLAQTKAFVERKHESNMSKLAAALDSERWIQCEVSTERQNGVTRLCSGRAIISSTAKRVNEANGDVSDGVVQKSPDIEVEGTRYKVVWSCLLLVEMILNDIATATHFPSLASSIVGKIAELLRLFNSRTTQLVLGAGAIHSHAKLKSINAKHLSLVTQCLGLSIAILPHIRAALMAQLPKKQHTLLTDLDQIRKEYGEHNEKVLNKFVTIIGGIVEHGLAKKIPGTDFDARAKLEGSVNGRVTCCVFLEGVSTNTRKMHQVLNSLLPPDHLKDTFSRIFAFIDTKVPALFIAATNVQSVFQQKGANDYPQKSPAKGQPIFSFPRTDEGKRQFLLEIDTMTNNLNNLDGVHPWDFTARNVLERRLEFSLDGGPNPLPDGELAVKKSVADTENSAASSEAADNDDTENQLTNGDVEGSKIYGEHALSPKEQAAKDAYDPASAIQISNGEAPRPSSSLNDAELDEENNREEPSIVADASPASASATTEALDVPLAVENMARELTKDASTSTGLPSALENVEMTTKTLENGCNTIAKIDEESVRSELASNQQS